MKLIALALSLLAPPAALAQDGWDLDIAADVAVASVMYEGGVGLAVQCREGQLGMAILGLPAAAEGEIDAYRRRALATGFDTAFLEEGGWRSDVGQTTVASFLPQRDARQLKRGGIFHVRTVPGRSGAAARRLAIPLPSDPSAIDRVLVACGMRTVDANDERALLGDLITPDGWRRSRMLDLRTPAGVHPDGQWVDLSCVVTAERRMRDCQVERESSPGVGEATLRDVGRMWLDLGQNAAAADGRAFYWTIRATVASRP